jgi:hypothetical protein
MRKILIVLTLMSLLSALLSCGGGGGGSSSGVTDKQASPITIVASFQEIKTNTIKTTALSLVSLRYTITGPDMDEITGIVPVSGNTVHISLNVPNGLQRRFALEILDENEIALYSGSATRDLDGTPATVEILMMTVEPPLGEISIVLSWGQVPFDLDAHLTGPLPDGERFHLYYLLAEDMYGSEWPEYVQLDLDDEDGEGPETVLISQPISGIYRYSVHDMTNRGNADSTALSSSGAHVDVYRGDALIRSFDVPEGRQGTLWTVFEMYGDGIAPVNTITYESDEEQIQGIHGKTDAILIRNLPRKSR